MKRIILLFILALSMFIAYSQVPEAFSYQAVVRNASGEVISNQPVRFRISIITGSESGANVYSETHPVTTNNFGLANLIIGTGDNQTGIFSPGGWGSDSHFIKIEVDINGGENYLHIATSQLLAVPYAFHAQTAETFTETDPFYTGSQATNITTTDITNLGNLSGVNTGDQDGSETIVTAGANVTITGSGTTESPYVVNATGTASLAIGDSYQGGIIFWLDATGQHGLIAATDDQSTGIQWYNGTYRYTGTGGDGLYAGLMNTAMIVATQMADNQTGNFAAKVCSDYSVTVNGITYGDWYLPSKYELNLLYQQKNTVGGFTGTNYWSSSEINNYNANGIVFDSGANLLAGKTTTNYVRAIRAF